MAPLSEPAANKALTLTANGYVGIAAGATKKLACALAVRQAHPSTGALTRAAQDEDLERAAHLSRTNPLVLSLSKDERERARNANLRLDKYSPDQPRVPAGQSDGGQWTSGAGGGASTQSPKHTSVGRSSLLDDRVYRPGSDGAARVTLIQAEGEPEEENEESERLKPEELAALALYRQKLRDALREVEDLDPNWRPPDQLTGLDAQGNPVFADEIKNMQETIDAAQARVAELRSPKADSAASIAEQAALMRARSAARAASVDPAELSSILANPTTAAEYANERAAFLQEQLPAARRGRITMAVGVLEDEAGDTSVVVSSNEWDRAARPEVRENMGQNEVYVTGFDHAEINILDYAEQNDLAVVAVGAGRPYCPRCAEAIEDIGGLATGRRRRK